jgi:hypothetical protein
MNLKAFVKMLSALSTTLMLHLLPTERNAFSHDFSLFSGDSMGEPRQDKNKMTSQKLIMSEQSSADNDPSSCGRG